MQIVEMVPRRLMAPTIAFNLHFTFFILHSVTTALSPYLATIVDHNSLERTNAPSAPSRRKIFLRGLLTFAIFLLVMAASMFLAAGTIH
jgi:hypothetical protein